MNKPSNAHYRVWFRETIEQADSDFVNHPRFYCHKAKVVVIYKAVGPAKRNGI